MYLVRKEETMSLHHHIKVARRIKFDNGLFVYKRGSRFGVYYASFTAALAAFNYDVSVSRFSTRGDSSLTLTTASGDTYDLVDNIGKNLRVYKLMNGIVKTYDPPVAPSPAVPGVVLPFAA
jgi:hypothetical protein